MERRATEVAKMIYDGNLPEGFVIDTELTGMVATQLKEAVIQGFGKDLPELEYGSPDWNMLSKLRSNVYSFAAAKNYSQLKDMTAALVDDKNQIRDFREFKEICNKINFQYNSTWLRTEYDTAIASAQMGGRWTDFESRGESMPYLQYVTAGDANVREEHAELDQVIRRIDDEFWDTYYPPNGYNCRCDVIQLPGDDYQDTDLSGRDVPELDPMFSTNLAKHGLVFPSDHPYYTGLPKEIEKEELKVMRQEILNWGRENLLDKTFTHPDVKGDIVFTNKSLKETINQPHAHYREKNYALYKVDDVISKAVKVDEIKAGKETITYLRTEIAGEQSYIVIKDQEGKNVFYSIVDGIKKVND